MQNLGLAFRMHLAIPEIHIIIIIIVFMFTPVVLWPLVLLHSSGA